jgi:hypothetical protein
MQPFRGTLTEEAGEASVDVEGSIESPDEAAGARRGAFEFPDSEAVMQSFLDGKTFLLSTDDGVRLGVRLDSVESSARPGFSRAEFSGV